MGVRKSSSAEFYVTVGSLCLAVCVLVVILGVDGGFSDRLERARVEAQGDIVRIATVNVSWLDGQGRTHWEIFDLKDADAIRGSVTMGQEVAACTRLLMAPSVPLDVPGGKHEVVIQTRDQTTEEPPPLPYMAVTPEYFRVMGLKVREGVLWSAADVRADKEVVVVGHALGETYPVGSILKNPNITRRDERRTPQEFTVIGVLAETGDSSLVDIPVWDTSAKTGVDNTAFMPYGVVKIHILPPIPGGGDSISRTGPELVMRPALGKQEESVDEVLGILRDLGYQIAEVRPESQLQLIYSRVSTNVSRLFLYVALISLALSGVNLTNLVLVRVIRESRYLGIRRATGASRLAIIGQVSRFSLGVGLIGAVAGIAVSLPAQLPLSALVGQPCRVDLVSAGRGCGLLVVTALLAALYPAWRATRQQPVTLIRFGLVPPTGRRLRFDARNVLAALGIAVGVAAVTLTIAVGAGSRDEVDRYLEAVGRDVLVVREQDPFLTGSFEATLTPEMADTFEAIPGVLDSAWQEWGQCTAASESATRQCVLAACDPDLLYVKRLLKPVAGSPFGEDGRSVVIGYGVAQTLFGADDATGRSVTLNGVEFRVSHVLPKRPKDMLDQGYDRDNAVYALWTPGLSDEAFASVWATREFWVKAAEGQYPLVFDLLSDLATEEGLRVSAPVGELSDLRRMTEDLTRVLTALASFGLVIGAAGVAGFMYVKVTGDARRIGILRALGASRRHVAVDYLTHSVRLCLWAGFIGLGLALLAVRTVFSTRNWPLEFSWSWAGLALGLSALAGTVAGWLPASRAASLSPVEAVRQE